MTKKRIAFDQDNVIADLLGYWLELYNEEYGDSLEPNQINAWNWHHLTHPNCQEKIYTYMDDPDFFANLPALEGSKEVLEVLNRTYDIYIVTAPFNMNNVVPKYNWLKKHFPFLDEDKFVFTRDKSIVLSDWLIDDKPKNLEGFKGGKVLFDAPHNQSEDRFCRVTNWQEVRKFFLKENLQYNTFDKVRLKETAYTHQYYLSQIGQPVWILNRVEGEFDYMTQLNNGRTVLLTEYDIEKF